MFKSILTIGLWATVFFLSGAQGWSEDMEDRFIDSDFDSSKTIFVDVKNASLVNVLKIISQQSGLSFIAAQDVADKQITLYLNKLPLNQALQMVLDANGLTYEMQNDSNVFVIKKKEVAVKKLILVTKVYQLKYATVSASPLNSTISTGNPGNSGSSGSSAGGGNSSSGGLETVVKDSLSPQGKVVEDIRTNSLIITDVPDQFNIIESTIAKLDVPIPQVLIEVEMLDVSKSTADQLGISYGATPLTFTGGSKFANWPFGANTSSSSSGSSSSTSSSSTSSSSSGTTVISGWNANGMTAALSFLTTKTDARTLARPRILTLNNQTAQIQISTDQAISITATTTTGTSSQTAYTPERYTTGVILKVTPQANLVTREVTMAVSPKVIDVILSVVQPPAGSIQGAIYDPETRGSDSVLKLKDGQSMVIGGLMTTQNNNTVSKLPFLGDLPLIGQAFRSKNKTKSERELIIFLTPHIIDDINQSALKGDNSSISPQEALNIQEASSHAQEINNSLNAYEMKK
jgi:type IV pilus assembly protein PilQ